MRSFFVKLFLVFILLSLRETVDGQPVPPAQVLTYLQQKINVFYVGRPNAVYAGLSVNPIPATTISNNTNGVIFGNGGNNRMSTCARLLLSLLKDRNRGGNGLFQDWVYNLLKIKDKPVNLYFFNDRMTPLNQTAASLIGIDTIRVNDGLRVWPCVWREGENSAGTIYLGETYFEENLPVFQNTLIELITSAEINSYRTLHTSGIFSFVNPALANTRFYASAAVMDNRFVTDQGVCNALSYTFDTSYQRLLYKWFSRPSMVLMRQAPSPNFENSQLRQNWILNNPAFTELGTTLGNLPSPRFNSQINATYGWLNFSTYASRNRAAVAYKLRNELTQAIIYNYCIQKLGLQTFINSIKYNNNRFITATPDNKFAFLLENICRVKVGTQPLEQLRTNPPVDKRYLAPIVLVHVLTGRSENFTYEDFSANVGAGFPQELFNLYTPDIRTAIRAISIPADIPDVWYSVRDQINAILNP